jgi:formylglycine-generating enzyme required for sulfatase activity
MKLLDAASAIFLSLVVAFAGGLWKYPQIQPLNVDLVTVQVGAKWLRVSRYEVTIAEWQRCFDDAGCSYRSKSGVGAAGKNFPVTGLNKFDVDEYVTWARRRSGMRVRLPTLAEWAGISHEVPLKKRVKRFTDPRLAWAADYGTSAVPNPQLRESGSFAVTPEGVADLNGNVWEWTATCANKGADGANAVRCPAFVVAGEHEAVVSVFVREPAEGGCASGIPPSHLGIRLVADTTGAS